MNAPRHIGIIMDGNRRWARSRSRMVIDGHRAGADKLEDVAEWAKETGVRFLTVYAFSTENWSRAEEAVAALMGLFEEYLSTTAARLRERAQVRFIGERERFSTRTQDAMAELERESVGDGKLTLTIALSYGGRAEILDAVNKLIEEDREIVTEAELAAAMWSSGIPDADLIIRTGGERRLSNFLTWQSVYSELFFTDTLWPDFSREEFEKILSDFAKRERRLGR